ncbi:hypothetical protein ACH0C8_16190, partial [Acetobacter lovaniensis]|uniref:hypothetical protein n=1 Tax=Acetobacter lovaniensis TaxID=104100 RepID=UPI00376FA9F3
MFRRMRCAGMVFTSKLLTVRSANWHISQLAGGAVLKKTLKGHRQDLFPICPECRKQHYAPTALVFLRQ